MDHIVIEVNDKTKIYFAVPANARTAGPELIHQIVSYFRKRFNFDAFIYPIPVDHPTPVPKDFEFYNNPVSYSIEDNKNNILIVPEIYLTVQVLKKFKNIRKVIWWLSIDNYLINRFMMQKRFFYLLLRMVNKLFEKFGKTSIIDTNEIALDYYKNYNFSEDDLIKQALVNLCSAKHVENYLGSVGLNNVIYISELLNEDFLKIETDTSLKENIIAYNPAKGVGFTRRIIESAKHLNFVPIQNMSRTEVIKQLQKAKVYIDFGNHPGRDRLPREAASLKCCVITNRRGGARLKEDMTIPEDYKFDSIEDNIPLIVKKIEDCLNNYNEAIANFEEYRKSIREEPARFLEDAGKVFCKVI